MNVETCLSPALIHLHDLQGKIAVVTDILRASSCMVAGLGTKTKEIVPVATVEEIEPFKNNGFIVAGERGGQKIEGFDIGNSPFEHMSEKCHDKSVVMTTTNGTIAITKSAERAEKVIIGAFLNLSVVTEYVKSQNKDLLIVCSGWKNRFSLEDTLFAGALIDQLGDDCNFDDDASLMAVELYQKHQGDLHAFMKEAAHTKRLAKFNVTKDIEYCMTKDQFDIVPVLKNGRLVTE